MRTLDIVPRLLVIMAALLLSVVHFEATRQVNKIQVKILQASYGIYRYQLLCWKANAMFCDPK